MNSSTLILCLTPEVGPEALHASVSVRFLLDNLHFEFETVSGSPFSYEPNPVLHTLNQNDPSKPFRHKPGSIISVEVSLFPSVCERIAECYFVIYTHLNASMASA